MSPSMVSSCAPDASRNRRRGSEPEHITAGSPLLLAHGAAIACHAANPRACGAGRVNAIGKPDDRARLGPTRARGLTSASGRVDGVVRARQTAADETQAVVAVGAH